MAGEACSICSFVCYAFFTCFVSVGNFVKQTGAELCQAQAQLGYPAEAASKYTWQILHLASIKGPFIYHAINFVGRGVSHVIT